MNPLDGMSDEQIARLWRDIWAAIDDDKPLAGMSRTRRSLQQEGFASYATIDELIAESRNAQ